MASAGNDESEEPAPGDDGGGDWTQWLRSRLERVAPPERRHEATGDEPTSGQPGAGATPAPRLPPLDPKQEPGSDPGLGLEWPSRRPEPSAGARGSTADDRGADAETAESGPPAAPASARAPAAPGDRPAPGPQRAGDQRPASNREAAPARSEATASPPARRPSRLAEPPAAVPSHELVAGLDRLQVAVSSLSARVDGLADATHSFRSVMNERLDEYTETVLRAAKSSASDLQEYRRMHTASLGEVRRNANETAETLRRLTGWMEELARIQGDDERWATALSQAFEEAAAERREGEERDHQVVSTLTERLKRIDQALGRLGEELAAEPPDPLLPVVTSLAERLERMEQALDGLAAQAGQPPLPAPLMLDDDAIAAIAAAVAERLAAPPPAPAPEPQPTTTETTETTERTSPTPPPHAAPAAPAAPARARRTTPIRAPSRSRNDR